MYTSRTYGFGIIRPTYGGEPNEDEQTFYTVYTINLPEALTRDWIER